LKIMSLVKILSQDRPLSFRKIAQTI